MPNVPYHMCPMCHQRKRIVNPAGGCKVCRAFDRVRVTDADGLSGGQWGLVGNIRRWIKDAPVTLIPPPRGRRAIPNVFAWDWLESIEAYRQYVVEGRRDDWAIEGNRVYKREAKRRQRASKTERKEVA